MKINEIKQEIVVRTEYVAEDGTVFHDKEECQKYEETALFVVSKKLKRLFKGRQTDIFYDFGYEENVVEIFDIQTPNDLDNLKKYIILTAQKNGCTANSLEGMFNEGDHRLSNLTFGDKMIIWWDYEQTWAWIYGDGSIEAYLQFLKDRITKLITPKETEEAQDAKN